MKRGDEYMDSVMRDLQDNIIGASQGQQNTIDDQEMSERGEAASAYSKESEKHFVDYFMDCKKTSVEANTDVRKSQAELYKMYKEEEPDSYKNKESWQSKTVVPKPFQTVQFGATSIKKAFTPEFLTIEDKINKSGAKFWQDVMTIECNDQNADFITRFSDATTMSLAVGISQEMIPQYVSGVGLRFDLIEPWKIHRDPDALSRDPQSGIFWIHEEWIDYFILQTGEKNGKYRDVSRCKNTSGGQSSTDDPFMTEEAIAERKKQIVQKSSYRDLILTGEFWGTILDPKGNMLLPNGTYTVAGYRVIEDPKITPYRTLRWPGISFSVIPDLLKFGGRGILESVKTIWEAMNVLMCLHEDNYKWVVNPPTEITVDMLVDPTDVESWPGKNYLANSSLHGQQAIRTVDRRDVSNSFMGNMQYYDQNYQSGSFVNDSVQGLPGYRKDITYGEKAQNLNQALGVFNLMGANIEHGAKWVLTAAREAVLAFAGFNDYLRILGKVAIENAQLRIGRADANGETVIENLPEPTGAFHISGMTALMKEQETIAILKDLIIPLGNMPRYAPYVVPYKTLKALESRLKLTDEGIFADEETAQKIQASESEKMQKGEHIQDTFAKLEAMEKHAQVEKIYAGIETSMKKLLLDSEEILIQYKQLELESQKIKSDAANKKDSSKGGS